MTDSELIQLLHTRFSYTTDNNRDLIGDSSFPLKEALEEVQLEQAYKVLVANLARSDNDGATYWQED